MCVSIGSCSGWSSQVSCAALQRHRQDAMQASGVRGLPSCEQDFFFYEVIKASACRQPRELFAKVYALILNLLDLVDDGTHAGWSSIESSCGSSWRREAEAQSSSRVRSRLTSSERDGGCES